ncbi:MAG: triose-phosphate isomerase [Candidatus Nealsonbacteria bacterium]
MKPLVVANWKSNPATLKEAKLLFEQVKDTGAVICPPNAYLSVLGANGAQDVSEVSALILKNLGVKYVIVGHSERRKYFKETNEFINQKLKVALVCGLKPILCIDKISQLPADLDKEVIVAYEPLFAIGTGKPCSLEKAKKMRLAIEKITDGANKILYGGSVNSKNARNYIYQAGFQGLLVGGASLDSKEFIDIIKNVC